MEGGGWVLPQRVLGDAGGNLTGSDADEAIQFADRMQDRIEQLAPGFSQRTSPVAS